MKKINAIYNLLLIKKQYFKKFYKKYKGVSFYNNFINTIKVLKNL